MDVSSPFVAHPESSEPVQPREGALHDPASLSQPTSMLASLLTDQRLDVALTQLLAVSLRLVSCVSLQDVESLAGPTPLPPNRRDSIDEGDEDSHVVLVRLRRGDRKGYPRSFHNEVVLAARLRPVGRVRPRFGPPG